MAKQFKKISLEDLVKKITEESTSTENPSKEEMVDFISKATKIYSPEDISQMGDDDIVNIYNELQDDTIGSSVKYGRLGEDDEILDEKKYPWDKCIDDQKKRGYSKDSANKICGSIKAKNMEEAEQTSRDESSLLVKAIKKAKAENNDWMLQMFSSVNPKRMSVADIEMCEDFLNGLNEYDYGVDPMMSEESKEPNPWAICHDSVGPKKNAKFEKCVKSVKKQYNIDEDVNTYKKYVDNIYERQFENDIKDLLYSFVKENGIDGVYDYEINKALHTFENQTEEDAFGGIVYTKEAIKGIIEMLTGNKLDEAEPGFVEKQVYDMNETENTIQQRGKYNDSNDKFDAKPPVKSNKEEFFMYDKKGRKVKVTIPSKQDEMNNIDEMWNGKLQKQYKSFEEFEVFDEIYNLSNRLGFASAEEAWEANPQIQGSSDPADYKVVKEEDMENETNLDELAVMISENEEIATLYNQLSDEDKENLIKEFVQAEKASYNNKTNNPSMNNLNKIKGENDKNNKAHEKEVTAKLKGAEADGTQFVSEKGNEKGEVEPKSFSQEKNKMSEDSKETVADAIMLNRGSNPLDVDYQIEPSETYKKVNIASNIVPDVSDKKFDTQYGKVDGNGYANIDKEMKVNKAVLANMDKKKEFRDEMPKQFNRYTTKLVKEGVESKIVISETEESKSILNYEDNTSSFSKEVRDNYLKQSVTLNENEQKELERIKRLLGYNPSEYIAKTKQVDSKFDINLKRKL